MIGPKLVKPTPAQERAAYELAAHRDAGTCQMCRRYCGPINRDHRKDRSLGGLTVVENVQLLRGSGTTGCHGKKTLNPAWALEEGWSVPGWADPGEWPARRYVPTDHGTLRAAWVLYDADGGWAEIPTIDAFDRMGRIS